MAKVAWLTAPQYAERIGRTRQYITKLVRTGKISKKSLKKGSKKILINPDLADSDLVDNLSHVNKKKSKAETQNGNKRKQKTVPPAEIEAKTKTAGTKGMSLADAQKLQAQYKAALLKLEYEEKSGKLVQVEDVEKDAFDMARIVRDAILNIPDRISAELASEKDPHIVSQKLTEELTSALEDLSK